MDEATSRDDIHVEHHSNTLENHEEGDNGEEAESSLLMEQEAKKEFMHNMVQETNSKDVVQDGTHPNTQVTHVHEEVHGEAERIPPFGEEHEEAEKNTLNTMVQEVKSKGVVLVGDHLIS